MPLKQADIVLCTVKRIESASVFVEIEGGGVGSLVMSEVAAGRIRNLREYVAPNKKIVCKVIGINQDNIQLSLRRVTARERDEAMIKYQKEKTFKAMLKAITKDAEIKLENIKKEYELADFTDEIRANPSLLNKFFTKPEAEQIGKIIQEKEDTIKLSKKIFVLRTLSASGLEDIKKIISKDAEVHYLGSSQFSISTIGKDFKEANTKLQLILKEIEEEAKSKKMLFEVKE